MQRVHKEFTENPNNSDRQQININAPYNQEGKQGKRYCVKGPRRLVPGGVVCCGILESDGVQTLWYCRQSILPSLHTYYLSLWLHGQTLLLHLIFFSRMIGPATGNPALYLPLLNNYILTEAPMGTTRDLNFSDNLTVWGVPQTKILSSKKSEAYNLGVHSTLVTKFHRTQNCKTRVDQAS